MSDFLSIAILSAKEAGKILLEKYNQSLQIDYKGEINPVTEADRLSEETIIRIIKEHFPTHSILSEESGEKENHQTEYKWIIDPLDGTVNYTHHFPFFAVSIAIEFNGEIIAGVVYNPIFNELFTAQKGKGAFLNDRKISVSNVENLHRSLLATGFPYDIHQNYQEAISHFSNFIRSAQAVRRPGSAAIDLCYTAMGRFDGFWEMKLKPWDTSAGSLIVTEAGGTVTDFSGNKFNIYGDEVLASNGKIHKSMIEVLKNGKI